MRRSTSAMGLTTLLLFPIFTLRSVLAADFRLLDDRKNVERGQAEYFNSNRDRRFEIKVNLVGGVQTPGIYHLPDNINLIEAISLAGGTINNADLSKVYVKRYTPNGFETFHYDLSQIIANKETQFPSITDRDTILIGTSNGSQTLTVVLSVIGTVLGVLTTTYLITQSKK